MRSVLQSPRSVLQSPQSSYASSSPVRSGSTLREQIILQPDDYIGSVEKRTQKLWVSDDGLEMTERVVTYVPGLLRIFEEVLIYAADNNKRDPTTDTLRVDVDVAKCLISVFNSGKGIPIEVHREDGVYVPEVIYGHLSNCYDNVEEEQKRNGFGLKLANIFSMEFIVETADGPGRKKYKQVFSENMGKKSEPEITDYRKGENWSWTRVTFKPDLAKFNMTKLEKDVVALMRKRVLDMAGILGGTVQVVFNGLSVTTQNFCSYIYRRYIEPDCKDDYMLQRPWITKKINDQLEVGMSVTKEGQFQQVSFVNKVATISGGTHVDYVSNLIVARALFYLKDGIRLRKLGEHDLKRHSLVFVNLQMENPTFSSPTKEFLTTPQEDFVSEAELPDGFVRKGALYLCGKLGGTI